MTQVTFESLEDDARIPTSSVRVVGLMRSRNVVQVALGGEQAQCLAYLITVYSLRGTYQMYAYLAPQDGTAGRLFGGDGAEAVVSRYRELEAAAMGWFAERGFDMQTVDIVDQELTERIATLSPLPFAHNNDVDADSLAGHAGISVQSGPASHRRLTHRRTRRHRRPS